MDAARSARRLCRRNFIIRHDSAGRRLLYFGGHSLGLQPKSAAAICSSRNWRIGGVWACSDTTSRCVPGFRYHERAAPALADLVGALESEVVAMNSLTVNLHLMMVSFFRPEARRAIRY